MRTKSEESGRARRKLATRSRILVGLLAAIGAGCGGSPERPTMEGIAASDNPCTSNRSNKQQPLLVEWQPQTRELINMHGENAGLLVVAYEGCNLRVLTGCTASGNYELRRKTQAAHEILEIKNEDDLYAALPLSAVQLGGQLKQGQQLRVEYAIAGVREASTRNLDPAQLEGTQCEEATHFVRAILVGASALYSMASESMGANVQVQQVGVGGNHSGMSQRQSTSGDLASCDGTEGPGQNCFEAIMLDLTPLAGRGQSGASAGAAQASAALPVPQGAEVQTGRLESGDNTLNSGELVDGYSVQVPAGGSLQVTADSSEIDTYVIVRGPGDVNEQNDDVAPGSNTNSALSLSGLAGGTYQVFVTTYQPGETGGYRVAIRSSAGGGAVATTQATGGNGGSGASFSPGFQPDPFMFQSLSGGNIAANTMGAGCEGYIANQPDHVFRLNAPFSFLRMFVSSTADTTLVVRRPNGTVQCNDDTYGHNPGIDGPAEAGVYQVWVGSYQAGTNSPYQFAVTELPSQQPGGTPSAASAPVAGGEPYFGTVSLARGFMPDPHQAGGRSGGTRNAQTLAASCRGWIADRPDFNMALGADFPFLRLFATSQQDTTLVVQTPSGQVLCNDDTFGNNPAIEGAMGAGTYRVWVGSYQEGAYADFQLFFTERTNATP